MIFDPITQLFPRCPPVGVDIFAFDKIDLEVRGLAQPRDLMTPLLARGFGGRHLAIVRSSMKAASRGRTVGRCSLGVGDKVDVKRGYGSKGS